MFSARFVFLLKAGLPEKQTAEAEAEAEAGKKKKKSKKVQDAAMRGGTALRGPPCPQSRPACDAHEVRARREEGERDGLGGLWLRGGMTVAVCLCVWQGPVLVGG